jgi:hypothetical protein
MLLSEKLNQLKLEYLKGKNTIKEIIIFELCIFKLGNIEFKDSIIQKEITILKSIISQ